MFMKLVIKELIIFVRVVYILTIGEFIRAYLMLGFNLYVSRFLRPMGASVNITAMAGRVRGVAKGGNTATGVPTPASPPESSSSSSFTKATANEENGLLKSVGKPPPKPPISPGWGTLGGALPGVIKDGGLAITIISTAAAATTDMAVCTAKKV